MDAATLVPGYARAGVAVLPLHRVLDGRCTCRKECATPGKHPMLIHGAKDAATDIGQIAEWMARWPQCNWGGVPPRGVVILDIDPRNGGDTSLADLEQQHGTLPSTLTARTGSGGTHIWLTHKGPARGKLAQGIDVKKVGGYVVLPPSIHACGEPYTWTNTAPATTAPRWVSLILNPPITRHSLAVQGTGNVAHLVNFLLTANEGTRNDRFYWACCRAVENGDDLAPLIDTAEAIGLSRLEAEATAESAHHAPQRRKAL